MTKFRMHYLLVAILSVAISTVSAKPPPKPTAKPTAKPTPQPMPLNVMATLVKNAVDECKSDKSLPNLSSAEFSFRVQTETTVGGTVSVWIVTLGASRTEDNISEVKFTYDHPEAPSTTKGLEALGFNGPNLTKLQDRLTGVIKAGAKSLKTVPSVEDAKFHKLTVTVAYQVKSDFNAGASIPIWSIIFGPKVDINQTNTHSITLVFAIPTASPTPTPTPSASQSPRPSPSATPATP